MKRDWDLIRLILTELEEEPDPDHWLFSSHIEGRVSSVAADTGRPDCGQMQQGGAGQRVCLLRRMPDMGGA